MPNEWRYPGILPPAPRMPGVAGRLDVAMMPDVAERPERPGGSEWLERHE